MSLQTVNRNENSDSGYLRINVIRLFYYEKLSVIRLEVLFIFVWYLIVLIPDISLLLYFYTMLRPDHGMSR